MQITIKTIAWLFTTLIITIGTPFHSEAQDYGFGVKTGFLTVTQTGNFIFSDGDINVDLDSGYMAGYTFGVFTRLTIDNNLRLLTELNYSRYGAAYDGSFVFQNQQIFTKSVTGIRYLQVPVMVEWYTDPPDLGPYRYQRPYWSWIVKGGLYAGYRVDAVFSGTNTARILGVDFESDFSNNVTDSYKAFDAGLTIGGGLEYGLTRKYGFETRFVMGLLDVGNEMNTRNMGLVFAFYFVM
jgi:hypothetical protein